MKLVINKAYNINLELLKEYTYSHDLIGGVIKNSDPILSMMNVIGKYKSVIPFSNEFKSNRQAFILLTKLKYIYEGMTSEEMSIMDNKLMFIFPCGTSEEFIKEFITINSIGENNNYDYIEKNNNILISISVSLKNVS